MAAAFGTEFIQEMAFSRFENGVWGPVTYGALDSFSIHPASHVLHYGSACFEGLKAFAQVQGGGAVFRMGDNIERLKRSSQRLCMPPIDTALTTEMIQGLLSRHVEEIPAAPGSLYIRPTHIGIEQSIGKASSPSLESILYVLLSPVGDYFAGGVRTLRILIETDARRCAPHMGEVKSAANYASALYPISQSREAYQADQVLFCPGGDVQETGAANFLLYSDGRIITRDLDSTFLHGITRDSILKLAAQEGYKVEERYVTVEELLELTSRRDTEAALSGTAAVLTPVGTLIHHGVEYPVGNAEAGPVFNDLRTKLNAIQWGQSADPFGWLQPIV